MINNEQPKPLMKDLFKLKNKYDSNKVEFNTQTVDRKGRNLFYHYKNRQS